MPLCCAPCLPVFLYRVSRRCLYSPLRVRWVFVVLSRQNGHLNQLFSSAFACLEGLIISGREGECSEKSLKLPFNQQLGSFNQKSKRG